MARIALAAICVAFACATSVGAAPLPKAFVSDCGLLVQHPKGIILACADGGYALEKLAWTNWGARTATATGLVVVNDCKPNCAAGHYHSYPARVTADRRTNCGIDVKLIYLRLRTVFTGKRPAGYRAFGVWQFTCAGATHG
jgi:hypothetical protein